MQQRAQDEPDGPSKTMDTGPYFDQDGVHEIYRGWRRVLEEYNPTGDPHEFEPSAQDTLKVKKASVLVFNGGHYDSYMEEAAANSDATAVDAYALLGSDEHADEAGGELVEVGLADDQRAGGAQPGDR